MTALSVNLNKIALLRNSREGSYPDVIDFAQRAVAAGANGLTVHPRPDQRHIRTEDALQLSDYVQSLDDIELNIEGNPFAQANNTGKRSYPGLMPLVEMTRPHQTTLVPDTEGQLTSDHGFNLKKDSERLQPIVAQLKAWGIRCSLFMDPDIEQIDLAQAIGADCIELYTGPYAEAYARSQKDASQLLLRYQSACHHAKTIGLTVNAGHDLNLNNLKEFLTIGNIAEVSIGHALTVDALLLGYRNAIVGYSKICHAE